MIVIIFSLLISSIQIFGMIYVATSIVPINYFFKLFFCFCYMFTLISIIIYQCGGFEENKENENSVNDRAD